jgi:hypothetical protein
LYWKLPFTFKTTSLWALPNPSSASSIIVHHLTWGVGNHISFSKTTSKLGFMSWTFNMSLTTWCISCRSIGERWVLNTFAFTALRLPSVQTTHSFSKCSTSSCFVAYFGPPFLECVTVLLQWDWIPYKDIQVLSSSCLLSLISISSCSTTNQFVIFRNLNSKRFVLEEYTPKFKYYFDRFAAFSEQLELVRFFSFLNCHCISGTKYLTLVGTLWLLRL